MLHEWLVEATEVCVVLIDAIALLVVAGSTFYTFVMAAWTVITRHVDQVYRRALWLRYGRWLVVGLTFQLAADIIESSTAPSWEAIGMLGAIAVIRTFLNYFLGRDIQEEREIQREERERSESKAEPRP
jgi:uncharacterized membrane protein